MKPFHVMIAVAAILSSPSTFAATCHQFDITIDAAVQGNFGSVQNRSREIAIVREDGFQNNTFEFAIRYPGDLNASSIKPGMIEIMTNSAFSRNAGTRSARFDLAQTS